MSLTPEEIELKKAWFQKFQGVECPLCHTKVGWDAYNVVFELREYHDGKLYDRVPCMPVFPLVCKNCGNTMLIDVIKTGVYEADPPKDK